jgi:hypothetical protein
MAVVVVVIRRVELVLPVVPVVAVGVVVPVVPLHPGVKVLRVVLVVVEVMVVAVVVLEPPVRIIPGTMRVMVVLVNSSGREVRLRISGTSTVKVGTLRVAVQVVPMGPLGSSVVHPVEAVVGMVETITGTWVYKMYNTVVRNMRYHIRVAVVVDRGQ